MNITEALKTKNLRITHGERWMYFDEVDKMWYVIEKKYRKRNISVLISTICEEDAIDMLLYGD